MPQFPEVRPIVVPAAGPRGPHPVGVEDRATTIVEGLKRIRMVTRCSMVVFVHRPHSGDRLPTLVAQKDGVKVETIPRAEIDSAFAGKGRSLYSLDVHPSKAPSPETLAAGSRRVFLGFGPDEDVEAVVAFSRAPRLWCLPWRRLNEFEHFLETIRWAVCGPRPVYHGYESREKDGQIVTKLLPFFACPVPLDVPASQAASPRRSTMFAGSGPAHSELMQRLERVAVTRSEVFLEGETGTGKGLAARALHEMSGVKGPFLKVNLAAVPESLMEAEFFGTVRGASTGAIDRPGWFEAAKGGTLFLDEIGDATPQVQRGLLAVIEDAVVTRLGSTKPVPVDVRLVFATNRCLEHEVRVGNFREDLYYRITGFRIALPPLRDRREDIPEIIGVVLAKLAKQLWPGDPRPTWIDPRAAAFLTAVEWPGNVRDLMGFLKQLLILEGPSLTLAAVEKALRSRRRPSQASEPRVLVAERDDLGEAWALSGGSVAGMATCLGQTARWVRKRLARSNADPRNGGGVEGGRGGLNHRNGHGKRP